MDNLHLNQRSQFYDRNNRLKRGVAWVCPDQTPDNQQLEYRYARKPGEFGPPVFDETSTSYYWRHFKKGFSYGFMLSTVVVF